ncbi:MAG: hypothetical protein M1819_004400 [Sarea resinae]|nr:MAG: hypothetical protein M1819_004400 [Sarea resinae]
MEQSVNNVIMLKHFVGCVPSVFEALTGATSELLVSIRELCAPEKIEQASELINDVINEDVTYASQPLDLRNQRTYAVKSGVNGLLDVARQTYKEANADIYELVSDLGREYSIALDLKYDNAHQFYIRIATSELEDRDLPPVFINAFRKRQAIECQTLDLVKRNQKVKEH